MKLGSSSSYRAAAELPDRETDYDPYVDHPTWQECKGCELGNDWATCEPCWTRKCEECSLDTHAERMEEEK